MDMVSVIVPVYNVKPYLDKCLKSILKQSYKNIEIILVDDGSTDGSEKLCDEYAHNYDNIKVVHKKNGGLSDARNIGLQHALGQYVMFVDSDDCVDGSIVEYLMNMIAKCDAEIGICDFVHLYTGKEAFVEQSQEVLEFNAENALIEMFYQKSFLMSVCGKIFKKQLWEAIRFPVGMLFEDVAIIYKVFERADKIVYGNAKLYGYMHRENSITTKKFTVRDCDILLIFDEISEYYKNSDTDLLRAVRAYGSSVALRIYMNAPRDGSYMNEISKCERYLKTNAKEICKDSKVRKKNRYALMLYLYAKPIMPFIYKRVNRWK